MWRILLVEDNKTLGEIIEFYINHDQRYSLKWVKDAYSALSVVREGFDVILLDIMLPDIDGISLCERLRETIYCPIIFISSLDDEQTIIKALNLGGDDYLVKPFKSKVLLAKVDAILRRVQGTYMSGENKLSVDGLRLNGADHTVRVDEKTVYLSPTEYSILEFFMKNKQRIIELEELYSAVWQQESYGDVRTVPVHVGNIRKKIEKNPAEPCFIKTIKRVGYYFDCE